MDDKTDAPLQPDQTEDKKVEEKDPSDNLTPDHPRFKDVIQKLHDKDTEIGDLKAALEDVKTSIADRQDRTGNDDLTQEEKDSLAKIDRELRKKGYLTKDELQEDKRVDRIARDFERLSDRYDGKNGYPKFIADEVAAHAKENGFDSMEAAYRDLHFDAIVDIEAKKRGNAPTPPGSEKATGQDRELSGDLTPEKIAEMDPAEYEKNRAAIKKSLRGR